MRRIPLRRRDGTVVAHALVDDDVYDRLGHLRWHLNSEGYVFRNYWERGRSRGMRLHREVLERPEQAIAWELRTPLGEAPARGPDVERPLHDPPFGGSRRIRLGDGRLRRDRRLARSDGRHSRCGEAASLAEGGGVTPPTTRMTTYTGEIPPTWLAALDPGIARYVELLSGEGVETFESCEGGVGHCFPEPTVRFFGHSGAGFHALAIALEHGLPVLDLRRYWQIVDGEPEGPHWEMTFRVAGGKS